MEKTKDGSQNIMLLCEDSLEGIFTGIYEAYALRIPHEHISLQIGEEETLMLFTSYRQVAADNEKAKKVSRTLRTRFGEADYYTLCMALSSPALEKAQAVYKTVVYGLSAKRRGRVLEHLSDNNIRRVMELNRGAVNELLHLKGFLRFQELENGLLHAVIRPKNNILPMLAEHFADRFPGENFIIHDEGRNVYALHPTGKEWFLMEGQEAAAGVEEEKNVLRLSAEEQHYQELFRHFCHNISIKDRKNLKLQGNMLPLRFRPYMVEFAKK